MASAVLNIAPEGNLSYHLHEIRRFPMLAPKDELALARRWRDDQDMEAAHKLVTSHLRLVAKIAMGYRGYETRRTRERVVTRISQVGHGDNVVQI